MRGNRLSTGYRAALTILGAAALVTSAWAASHHVVHSFNPVGTDGAFPYAGLTVDAAGNRYGTTNEGGTYNVGTVFELTPTEGGGWTETVLHNFDNNGRDGNYPQGGLLLDAAGNLYGTTIGGGIHGDGALFELTPQQGGGWAETVLHSFGSTETDGQLPYAGLIFDTAGNIYGTTELGGGYYEGTVFELSSKPGGGWTETVLHSFGRGTDGTDPYAGLVLDSFGNLYGTTASGGIHPCSGNGCGTAFELSPKQGGGWTESVLHSFGNGTDGYEPSDPLIVDNAGNLYGTTVEGGIHGFGTVFELSPKQGGGWTETVLHSFGSGSDGTYPNASLIIDTSGDLYGTTTSGGIHGYGTTFELTPREGGGWTETVLHSFNVNGPDGSYPYAALIVDGAGDLYGTTRGGGASSVGTVFELTPREGGGFAESVVYSFNFNGADGANPFFSTLIRDAAGNLYGTTNEGGTYDFGTVFELSPNGGEGLTETVLYSFGKDADGAFPYAGLIFDAAGNLYGSTFEGGIHGLGTVFELSPKQGGGWTETVLHSFGRGTDGTYPYAGVVFDRVGNLYGTTFEGGIHGFGTVFELSPKQGGGWTETVLHSFNFNGTDGALPYSALTIDSVGNLYGTTGYGGIHFEGTAFEVSPNEGGGWTETVLHSFNFNGTDGAFPYAELIFDGTGNLYGTTSQGGIHFAGTVFQLAPRQGGGWTETVLHSFNANDGDGFQPYAGLIFDGAGNLYGTTVDGGTHGRGTVFELMPSQRGNWTETVLHNFNLDGEDGNFPEAGLVFDAVGNLYGTATYGGIHGDGAVFEITP